MDEEGARRFFEAIAPRYDRVYAMPREASRERMARILAELAPASRVLDLGVGTGRELGALLDAGHAPTGLDFSAEMLALCNRRARPIPTVLASFWQPLPFPDGTFDAVIALHGTLAHPPADGALLALGTEVARVLVPGGCFLAETPSLAWLDTLAADVLEGRRARRTAPERFLYEDQVSGASIEAMVLADDAWAAALGPALEVEVREVTAFERLVVSRRVR
jgi:SAM-dependent methyltransferase